MGLDSQPGQGTTFWFTLPAVPARDGAAPCGTDWEGSLPRSAPLPGDRAGTHGMERLAAGVRPCQRDLA